MNSTNKLLLQQAGFIFFIRTGDNFATTKAEKFNAGKHHFFPEFRDFFLGKASGGFYCTSHLIGPLRKYRCRNTEHDGKMGNIFGMGVTEDEAVKMFLENFKTKTYNVTP